MNCDAAFDALTDPAGGDSAALARHLSACARCRALQQVLEPALGSIANELALDPPRAAVETESDDRRAKGGLFLSVEAVRLAEETAVRLARPSVPERGGIARRSSAGPVRATFQSLALVLFGALGVYVIGPRNRDVAPESVAPIIPAASPATVPRPLRSCSRNDFPRSRKGSREPATVVLSCVACHMQDHVPTQPVRTSLQRQHRRVNLRQLLASMDDELADKRAHAGGERTAQCSQPRDGLGPADLSPSLV